MPKLWLEATHKKTMQWGVHDLSVTKQRKGHVIHVSEELFDAIRGSGDYGA